MNSLRILSPAYDTIPVPIAVIGFVAIGRVAIVIVSSVMLTKHQKKGAIQS